MATEAGKARARQVVLNVMAERDWNPATLATEAKIDYGTAGDFLNGKRWPKVGTLGKIDRAVGWTSGTLAGIGEGLPESTPEPTIDLGRVTTVRLLHELGRRLGLDVVIDEGPADREMPSPPR